MPWSAHAAIWRTAGAARDACCSTARTWSWMPWPPAPRSSASWPRVPHSTPSPDSSRRWTRAAISRSTRRRLACSTPRVRRARRAAWSPSRSGPRPRSPISSPARQTLVLALDGVQDPGNVGGIIRSADALGASGVVAAGHSADPGNWKSLRGSAGSIFRIPVARGDLGQAIQEARRRHVAVVAAVPRDGRDPFSDSVRAADDAAAGSRRRGTRRVRRRVSRRSRHGAAPRWRRVAERRHRRSPAPRRGPSFALREAVQPRQSSRPCPTPSSRSTVLTSPGCPAPRSPSGCGRARSTSSSARRSSSAPGDRCGRRSSAARCTR